MHVLSADIIANFRVILFDEILSKIMKKINNEANISFNYPICKTSNMKDMADRRWER